MKQRILPLGLLLAVLACTGAALYGNGSYVVYILTYVFSFALLLCDAVFATSSAPEKLVRAIVYALLLAAQIVFAVLVVRPAGGAGPVFDPYRLSGVLVTLVPFLVRQIWSTRT